MSHTYSPGDIKDAELREEAARLKTALGEAQPEFRFLVRHVAPTKTYPGQTVYADGTNWDPGSGEGVYVRNAANAAWRYLG